MQMTKQWVIAAIEQTGGKTPDEILKIAKATDHAKSFLVRSGDYVPAMRELVEKGYSIRVACKMIISMGCPFAEGTLQTEFHRQRKAGKQ